MRITLTYHPDTFRKLYYQSSKYWYFKNKEVSKLLFFLSITCMFVGAEYHSNSFTGFLIVSTIITVWQLIKFMMHTLEVAENNEALEAYLDRLNSIEKFELLVGRQGISLLQDDEETTYEWSTITSCYVSTQFVFLTDNKGITLMVPSQAMTKIEYDYFLNLVSEKLSQIIVKIADFTNLYSK